MAANEPDSRGVHAAVDGLGGSTFDGTADEQQGSHSTGSGSRRVSREGTPDEAAGDWILTPNMHQLTSRRLQPIGEGLWSGYYPI